MLIVIRCLVPALCLLLASCSGGQSCAQAMLAPTRACAAGVNYQGHFYAQWTDKLPTPRGSSLGRGVYPACVDGGDCATPAGKDVPTQVWALRGVPPRVAIVGRSQSTPGLAVFGRLTTEPSTYFRLRKDGQWHLRR